MEQEKISMRELLALLFAALLCPAVRALPARTAGAGRGGWLTALLALPVLLLLCGGLLRLLRQEGGLSQALRRTLGRGMGTVAAGLYLLWGVVLLCVNLRLFGLRAVSAGYRNAPMPLFMAALLALALWLARRRAGVLVRAGQVFALALALGLGTVLVLGSVQVDPKNVLPVWVEDLPGAAAGTLPVFGVLGNAVYGAFFGESVTRQEGGRKQVFRWAAAVCLTLAALQWVCLGAFGPGLTGRMEAPFFMMVKGVGIEGAFERVEAVIIALWVFADLALLALLLRACCKIAADILPIEERQAAWPLAVIVLAGALWLFPNTFLLENWLERVVLPGNLVAGFVLPVGALFLGVLRRRV